jgi:hypothetical protein
VAPRKKALDWFALGMTVKDLAEGLWPQVTVGEETPLTLVEASEKTQLHEAARLEFKIFRRFTTAVTLKVHLVLFSR